MTGFPPICCAPARWWRRSRPATCAAHGRRWRCSPRDRRSTRTTCGHSCCGDGSSGARERRARDSNPEGLADAGFQDRCNSHSANPPTHERSAPGCADATRLPAPWSNGPVVGPATTSGGHHRHAPGRATESAPTCHNHSVETAAMNLLARNWGWMALRGAAALLFGILTLVSPGISLAVLVLWFGAYAVADGIFTIVTAVANRRGEPHWVTLL